VIVIFNPQCTPLSALRRLDKVKKSCYFIFDALQAFSHNFFVGGAKNTTGGLVSKNYEDLFKSTITVDIVYF
jgi:hypothetical protein